MTERELRSGVAGMGWVVVVLLFAGVVGGLIYNLGLKMKWWEEPQKPPPPAVWTMTNLEESTRTSISAAMDTDESPTIVIPAQMWGGLVGTDRRVFIHKKSLSGSKLSSWEYNAISGVEVNERFTTIDVILQLMAGPASSDRDTSTISDAPNVVEVSIGNRPAIDDAIAKLRHMVSTSRAADRSSTSDVIDELRRLAELRREDVLSEAEFQAKKQQMLGL